MYRPAHRAPRPKKTHIALLVIGVLALLIPAAAVLIS